MKILLTVDPELPVPPKLYGGIERIIYILANGLVDRGHDVTLIAHRDSDTKAQLVPYSSIDWRTRLGVLAQMMLITKTVALNKFDIVHSNSRVASLTPILPMRVPKLMTYHRKITPSSIIRARKLAGASIEFSAVSGSMIRDVEGLAPWHVVYNGVPLRKFELRETVDAAAPLAFLGRIEPIKGPHVAIEVARRSGSRLIIAGNIPDECRGYFEERIAPHIDGEVIRYIGPVDDEQKNVLLGRSRALLMPILWEEPFGIVMAEAFACGAPVIGFRRGSVPEVVEDGVTGFICDTAEEMAQAVERLGEIDRRRCRLAAETRFSEEQVIEGFLDVYNTLVSRGRKT